MIFLYPSVLWGLLFLAVPFAIHLFSFRKTKVVTFSTIHHIEALVKDTQSKRNLKHLLILLSRLLVIFFMVIAFARPVWMTGANTPVEGTLIYIDNSRSMTSEVAVGQSGLNKALQMADDLLSQAPIEQRFQVITNNSMAPVNWISRNSAMDKLANIVTTGEAKTMSQIMAKTSFLASNMDLYYFSDFQESTFGEIVNTNVRVNFLKMEIESSANVYVDTAFMEVPMILDEGSVLTVVLKNSGRNNREDVQVKILSGKQLIASSLLDFESNGQNSLSVDIPDNNFIDGQFKVEIEDFPVYFDNTFYLSHPQNKVKNIAHIHPENSYSAALADVYANEKYFDYTSYNSGSIDYTKLKQTDLIVLEGFVEIPLSLFSFKGVADFFIIPAKKVNKSSYEAFLERTVREVSDSAFVGLKINDINDPFFKGVFKSTNEVIRLPKAKRLFALEGRFTTLVKNEFGYQYLVRTKQLDRNIFFLASPIGRDFTNLTSHATFLPLMYKMAQSSNAATEPLYFDISANYISLPINGYDPIKKITLANESVELIANYQYAKGNLTLELPPEGILAGHYELRINDLGVQKIALNEPKNESDITTYSDKYLQELASNSPYLNYINVENIKISADSGGINSDGNELFKYALILALVFVISETLLIRFL